MYDEAEEGYIGYEAICSIVRTFNNDLYTTQNLSTIKKYLANQGKNVSLHEVLKYHCAHG